MFFSYLWFLHTVTRGSINVENIDVNVFGDDHNEFIEIAINESLESAKHIIDGKDDEHNLEVVLNGLNAILSNEKEEIWNNKLINPMSTEMEREYTKLLISQIKASMEEIKRQFSLLKHSNFKDVTNNSTIVVQLANVLNILQKDSTIFEKRPEFTFQPLFSITPIVAIMNPTHVSCALLNMLLHQRLGYTLDRFHAVQFGNGIISNLHYGNMKSDVLSLPYNRTGYMHTNKNVVDCEKETKCEWYSNLHIKDRNKCYLSSSQIYCTTTTTFLHLNDQTTCLTQLRTRNEYNCIRDYMGLLRFRIEQTFQHSIDSLNGIEDWCKAHKHPTGW